MTTVKKISVRLLREGRSVEDALTPRFSPGGEKPLVREGWNQVVGAEMVFGQVYKGTPGWTGFVNEGFYDIGTRELNSDEDLLALESSGAGCAIFVPVRDRLITVCFGRIHLALNDDPFERQFGLKVALNAVPSSGLRTLDLATPDAVTFQRRIQASKDSEVAAFGVDPVRDLARVAGGTPRDADFAKFVAGKDSLSMTAEVSVQSLEGKCYDVLAMYEKRRYVDEYPWVDQFTRVQEKDVIEELDECLFLAICSLRTGTHEELHMAPPEIVDYLAGSELRFSGFRGAKTPFSRLTIEDYVTELEARGFDGDVDAIKRRHVVEAVVGDSREFTEKWKVYSCFVFETTLEGDDDGIHYVLATGSWHRVTEAFQRRVEEFFSQVERRTVIGPTYCRNERELIDDLAEIRTDLVKLDQVKINPVGTARAQIEPCDFLSQEGEFIHIKDGESSGPISHLWSQGTVSADALVGDEKFVRDLRTAVAERDDRFLSVLPQHTSDVGRGRFTVLYAIMRRPYRDGSLGMPFFSKVSLQAPIQYVRKLGFEVAIELIRKRDVEQ